jgi:ABC-type cobalt transport system substrate-binding protein
MLFQDLNVNKNSILLSIIILLLLILIYKIKFLTQENAGSVGSAAYSSEAVQNIAKVYADTSGTAIFNNVDITGNLNIARNLNIIPRGTIVAFNTNSAPNGWALCDGGEYTASNGDKVRTPDLRGRFIRMAYKKNSESIWGDILNINVQEQKDANGTSTLLHDSWSGDNKTFQTAMMNHNFGEYGGSDWRIQSVNQMPAHSHSIGYQPWAGGPGFSGGGNGLVGTTVTSVAGSGWSMGIMPPYYVLTYIMKL